MATASITPLAWETSYAEGVALEKTKKRECCDNTKKKKNHGFLTSCFIVWDFIKGKNSYICMSYGIYRKNQKLHV